MKVALEVYDIWGAVLLVQKVVHKLLHFLLEWAIEAHFNFWESFFFSWNRWRLEILELYFGLLIMILRVRRLLFEDLRDLYFLFDSMNSFLYKDDRLNLGLWSISPGCHLLALICHLDRFLIRVDFKHNGVSCSYPMGVQLSYLGPLSLSLQLSLIGGLQGHVLQSLDVRCGKWRYRSKGPRG
jgi:hypothetical protein